ncbi:pentatricopeptide repeat domain-containing protein-like protein [Phlyctema vagabunda]|uniref:Pentatricopeptide repeat domain-containing protein-like protein n=1 Tax=Phlyctema vagabunda TaxID=108571 RepID=A0ABR4PNH3_9HELO
MRPALDRLLARPSSLELLRYLTGSPILLHKDSRCPRKCPWTSCMYSSYAVSQSAADSTNHDEMHAQHGYRTARGRRLASRAKPRNTANIRQDRSNGSKSVGHQARSSNGKSQTDPLLGPESPRRDSRVTTHNGGITYTDSNRADSTFDSKRPRDAEFDCSVRPVESAARRMYGFHGKWRERRWTYEELEFESDLSASSSRRKLLDDPVHQQDFELWGGLLEFRQRIYGLEGVEMYWKAVRGQKLQIPTFGTMASNLWRTFLTLGFEDSSILQDIRRYADEQLESTGQRWNMFYVAIIQHFLLTGQGHRAQAWHNKLIERHPPGPRSFSEMCRQVCLWSGDLDALKYIYAQNGFVNTYSKIVPLLCDEGKYEQALEWHFLLVQHKDLPRQMKSVESLLRHFTTFKNETAMQIAESLVDAKVPFTSKLSTNYNEHLVASAEMMNIIHGKTINVAPKKYNDSLGARWFATTWISLDIALNGVHALGVEEIGPLSLQSIALRETDAAGIMNRIDQLKELGISIGQSVYSKAVYHFAKTGQHEYLESLLQGDQHPDSLEDSNLQETLLDAYAQANDWSQYRRTLAIRLIASNFRRGEVQNIELRSLICMGDLTATRAALSHMQFNKIPVHSKTINYLIMKFIRKRQRGQRPIALPKHTHDLEMVIEILKDIMRSGMHLFPGHWREIIRRLGMSGRLSELYRLCIFLADWYSLGRDTVNEAHSILLVKPVPRPRVPAGIPNYHDLHPMRVLFPISLQKSIVEWGFAKALEGRPKSEKQGLPEPMSLSQVTQSNSSTVDITSGIKLLRRLQESGVHIDSKAVRSAIFNRLVQYYGNGFSKRPHNRAAKLNNHLTLEEMLGQINWAMGEPAFPRITDIREAVESRSLLRMRKRKRSIERLVARRSTDILCAPSRSLEHAHDANHHRISS